MVPGPLRAGVAETPTAARAVPLALPAVPCDSRWRSLHVAHGSRSGAALRTPLTHRAGLSVGAAGACRVTRNCGVSNLLRPQPESQERTRAGNATRGTRDCQRGFVLAAAKGSVCSRRGCDPDRVHQHGAIWHGARPDRLRVVRARYLFPVGRARAAAYARDEVSEGHLRVSA